MDIRKKVAILSYMKKTLFLFCLISVAVTVWAQDVEEWRLRKDTDGVQIWTRPVSGYAVDHFKAQAELDFPMESVYGFLTDLAGYENWVAGCREFDILERRSDGSQVYYIAVGAPLARDRDYTGLLTADPYREGEILIIQTRAVNIGYPPRDHTIRVTDYEETWVLEPLSDGRTRASLQAHFDPGGHLPKAIVNWILAEGPFRTYEIMRETLGG